MRSEFKKLLEDVKTRDKDFKIGFCNDIENLIFSLNPKKKYFLNHVSKVLNLGEDYEGSDRGNVLIKELCKLCELISESAKLTKDDLTDFYSISEIALKFNVSERTIFRWKTLGLVGRKYRYKKKIKTAILHTTLESFESHYSEIVSEASKFARLSLVERLEINEMLERLMKAGLSKFEAIHVISIELDRDSDTIKTAIVNCSSLDDYEEAVYTDFTNGVNKELIRTKYCLSKKKLQNIVEKERINKLKALEIDFMSSPEFDTEQGIEDLEVGEISDLLTKEQEKTLFKKYNYFKKLAKEAQLDENWDILEKYHNKALELRNTIWVANERLVWQRAKKQPKVLTIDDFVSEGRRSLFMAIEKFDYTQGLKFSTYAVTALNNNYFKMLTKYFKYNEKFQSHKTQFLDTLPDNKGKASEEVSEVLKKAMKCLTDREKGIVMRKFAIGSGEPQTLKEIGQHYGISVERVRQLLDRSLNKLKNNLKNTGLSIGDLL